MTNKLINGLKFAQILSNFVFLKPKTFHCSSVKFTIARFPNVGSTVTVDYESSLTVFQSFRKVPLLRSWV